jgi:trigger factor
MAEPDFSVTTEELPGSQVGLTVEVPQADVDRAFDRVLQRLQQRVKIEGFRPGKAPRELVEARVGAAALREEAIELLVPEVVTEILREREIEAIDRPRVDIQEFERGRPARFSAKVSVYPEVRLPDLGELRVERPVREVTEEDVEQRIEELRDRLAEVTPVERAAQLGDVVVADIDVSIDGTQVPSERRRGLEAELKDGVLIPELLSQLPGMLPGEAAEADITLPEDHVDPDLRSKPAHIVFTVQGVKEKKLPELDAELAKRLTEGKAEDVGSLRRLVREDLEEASRRLSQLAYEQAVVKAVVDQSEVELPGAMVDHELAHQLERLEERLQQQGLRLDRYLAYLQKSPEEWIAEQRPDAEARLKVDLVLEEAGKQLQIEPTNDEVVAYMSEEASKDPELKDRYLELVASPATRDFFRHRLTRLRILERLVQVASGGEQPVNRESEPRGDG